MRVTNRTFIVSGGSSGLGLATAQELIKDNAYVSILDLSPPLTNAEGSLESERVIFIKTDITNMEDVQHAVGRTLAWAGETGAMLGGVINCAGIGKNELLINRAYKPHSLDVWDSTLAVNVTGTFNLTRLALRHLVCVPPEDGPDGERGVIIMVASEEAYAGQPGHTAYAASKGAIRSMTLPMARELAHHHIRVVTISPGPFATPMTDKFSARVHRGVVEKAALFPKRYGIPEEFATTVKWVFECAYVNGEVIRLTGGSRVPAWL